MRRGKHELKLPHRGQSQYLLLSVCSPSAYLFAYYFSLCWSPANSQCQIWNLRMFCGGLFRQTKDHTMWMVLNRLKTSLTTYRICVMQRKWSFYLLTRSPHFRTGWSTKTHCLPLKTAFSFGHQILLLRRVAACVYSPWILKLNTSFTCKKAYFNAYRLQHLTLINNLSVWSSRENDLCSLTSYA